MQGMSIEELLRAYPDDAAAEKLFAARRWPHGIICPMCGHDDIQQGTAHPQMPYRCRACRGFFSVRTGTVMRRTKIGYRGWLIAMHWVGVEPSRRVTRRLVRELGISERSARFLARRIREACGGWPGAA